MTRRESLGQLLDQALAGDLPPAAPLGGYADPWAETIAALGDVYAQRSELAAHRTAGVLLRGDLDDETRLLAMAVAAFATAGWPVLPSPDQPDHLVLAADEYATADLSPDLRTFIAYLIVESALACARLAEAVALAQRFAVESVGVNQFLVVDGRPHPYADVMTICRIRLLAFTGRIDEARALTIAQADLQTPSSALLRDATDCLVLGNAADRSGVRRLAARLEAELPSPDDYLSSGCYLLVAFGLIAVGDVADAARLTLIAGRGPELDSLNIIDRVLGLELLTAAATAAGDLDSAEAWRALAEPMLGSPIANSTVERLISRVELLAGRPESAAAWAESAVADARAQGRAVEAAEGEIVLSRARIALAESGAATRGLEEMVARSDDAGHAAARVSAARELRAIGRRLRPAPGSEWAGLSERERDVALMLAEGLSNREIASDLFVSEHTVRAHVSRVLAAFGTPSRTTVAVHLAERPGDDPLPDLPELTAQQQRVADLIATGLANPAIATELGVSVRTVEKHVGDVLRRWSLRSRVGIARAVVAARRGRETAVG
jgi:DNA-binding NarL/FixJ family response regulator